MSDNNKYSGTDYVGEDTETFKFISLEKTENKQYRKGECKNERQEVRNL